MAPGAGADASSAKSNGTDSLALLATASDLFAPSPKRLEAIRKLGTLGDDRLIQPLTYLIADGDPRIRAGAIRAVATIGSAASEDALIRIVRHPGIRFETREDAVATLAAQDRPSTPDRLLALAGSGELPTELKLRAVDELRTRYPDRMPKGGAPPSRPGKTVATLSGAAYGAYALYAIGDLGEASGGPAIGFIAGSALGGTAGYLLGANLELDQALAVLIPPGIGLWTGVAVGYGLLDLKPGDDTIHLLAVGGELAGLGVGLLGMDWAKSHLEGPRLGGGFGLGLSGAALGGITGHWIASIPGSAGPTFWGAVSGAALGFASARLLGEQLTAPHAALLTTGTGWGLLLGNLAVRAAQRDGTGWEREGVTLAGGIAGLGIAQLAWDDSLTPGDIGFINAAGATALALGFGLVQIPEPRDDARPAMAALAGSAAFGLAAGRWLAPQVQFSPTDIRLTLLAGAHGLFSGIAIPGVFETPTPDRHQTAGAFIGVSMGLVGGALLAQSVELTDGTSESLAFADGLGSFAGLGIGLLAAREADSNAPNIGFLAGGAAGLGAAAYAGDRLRLSSGDRTLVLVSSAWGGWQGLALAGAADVDGQDIGGISLLAIGGSGAAALAASTLIEPTPGQVLAAASGGVWGAWASFSSLLLLDRLDSESSVYVIVGVSDLALAVTGALLAGGASPTVVGVADIGGLGGGALAALLAGLASGNGKALLGASLVGSGLGLLGGAMVGRWLDTRREPVAFASSERSGWHWPLTMRGLGAQPVLDAGGRVDGLAVTAVFE